MELGTVLFPGGELNTAKIKWHFLKYKIKETSGEPPLKLQMSGFGDRKWLDWKLEQYIKMKFKKPLFFILIQKQVQEHSCKSKPQTTPSAPPRELFQVISLAILFPLSQNS